MLATYICNFSIISSSIKQYPQRFGVCFQNFQDVLLNTG